MSRLTSSARPKRGRPAKTTHAHANLAVITRGRVGRQAELVLIRSSSEGEGLDDEEAGLETDEDGRTVRRQRTAPAGLEAARSLRGTWGGLGCNIALPRGDAGALLTTSQAAAAGRGGDTAAASSSGAAGGGEASPSTKPDGGPDRGAEVIGAELPTAPAGLSTATAVSLLLLLLLLLLLSLQESELLLSLPSQATVLRLAILALIPSDRLPSSSPALSTLATASLPSSPALSESATASSAASTGGGGRESPEEEAPATSPKSALLRMSSRFRAATRPFTAVLFGIGLVLASGKSRRAGGANSSLASFVPEIRPSGAGASPPKSVKSPPRSMASMPVALPPPPRPRKVKRLCGMSDSSRSMAKVIFLTRPGLVRPPLRATQLLPEGSLMKALQFNRGFSSDEAPWFEARCASPLPKSQASRRAGVPCMTPPVEAADEALPKSLGLMRVAAPKPVEEAAEEALPKSPALMRADVALPTELAELESLAKLQALMRAGVPFILPELIVLESPPKPEGFRRAGVPCILLAVRAASVGWLLLPGPRRFMGPARPDTMHPGAAVSFVVPFLALPISNIGMSINKSPKTSLLVAWGASRCEAPDLPLTPSRI